MRLPLDMGVKGKYVFGRCNPEAFGPKAVVKRGIAVFPSILVKSIQKGAKISIPHVNSGIFLKTKYGVLNNMRIKGCTFVYPGSIMIGSIPSKSIIDNVPTGQLGDYNGGGMRLCLWWIVLRTFYG